MNKTSARTPETILLTGASGYIGGRLLGALEARGRPLRCLARKPEYLRQRVAPETELVRGDCLDPVSLRRALAGVHTAYYLVHSMAAGDGFEELERRAATQFGEAARASGVHRIIYLGGLGARDTALSPHLRSRHETGECLRASGVPVVELRASVILGSGSLSFELIRALVERLPVMLCPRWVHTQAQPIAVEDVIAYLLEALERPEGESASFDIGGAERVSYAGILREYARQRGLRRVLIPVPFLTPRLSSLWLGLTTPVYARVGRHLIEGVRHATVVENDAALHAFRVRPMDLAAAIQRAMHNEDQVLARTRWSDALSSAGRERTWGGVRFGSRLVDSRTAWVDAPASAAFEPIRRIGGEQGWYFAQWLWRARGFLDLLAGGAGLRRGRRDPEELRPGDALDFWRVEDYEPNRCLRLAAEMKLPGRAWLDFEVEERAGRSCIRQTAVFDPAGLAGLLYWYGIYPLHALVFRGMLRGIARRVRSMPASGR